MKISDEPKWAKGLSKPPAWRSEGTETVFDSPWLALTRHPATAPTGHAADYAVVRFKNVGTGALPVHDDGTVTLVGQQRFALANYSWEMPEGGAPLDEDPFDGIRRELAEEAGLEAEHWLPALKVEMSNSVTDEIGMTWIAWGLSPAATAPDPTEIIAVVRVPFLDLLDEIGRGTVRDSLTVATAYKAYHMAMNGELPEALARALLGRV
ncbi:NUDIX domain-containing protein [Brevundimonas sp.]|uniref:NUDIX domain-containing protein n=1 Tax=Brevundimonas sp. TaxID=1871086 RepID=UPI00356AF8DD